MKKVLATSMLFLLAGGSTFAQQYEADHKCGTYTHQDEIFKMYPELEDAYYAHRLLLNSKMVNTEKSGEKSVLYTIPVVFHILHQYGNENITDAQVYDAMRVINEEFNAADPDSANLLPPYDTLIGNGQIQFKLAAVDPYGNCTNGIEHIYSHETLNGDAYSKIHQWNRSRYLNIWVVDVVGQAGAAAYATQPASTDGTGFWLDGVLSNYTYVGSIAPSNPGKEHVLTHEIGHYFSLDHVWGGTNDPEVACGDDGVPDTPITAGHASCPLSGYPNAWIDCDTAGVLIEDVQNYMEYSYCNYHFTPDQVTFMHNALNEVAGQRNNLWLDTTLIITGIKDQTLPQTAATVPLCAPIADFISASKTICVNQPMTFTDASYNAVIDSWEWTFQDGSPATSNAQNPSVTFTSSGYKTVTLTVSNAAGSGTETRTGYIFVSNVWGDFAGPNTIDMETGVVDWFVVNNLEENYAKFQVVSGAGYNNSRAWKLNNHKDNSNADPFTDEAFYFSRLGKSVDELITPSFDLRYTTGTTVSFKFAYATNATQEANITEKLRAYISDDCGQTWSLRTITVDGSPNPGGVTGADIVTGGYAGFTDYTPSTNQEWATGTFTVPSTSEHTRFKFVFEASDYSSNFYIDDINVSGTLSITTDEISALDLNVFPNPTSNGQSINVSYAAQSEPVTFMLRDAQGKLISTEVIEATNTAVNQSLNGTENLGAGCYFLEVHTAGNQTTRKVVVL